MAASGSRSRCHACSRVAQAKKVSCQLRAFHSLGLCSEVCLAALGVKDWCAVDVLPSGSLTILESWWWLSGCIELCSCLSVETVLVVALSSNLPHCDKCRRSLSSVIHTCDGFWWGGRRWMVLLQVQPRIRRDYPLNLSISLGGGKETNKYSLSNGE
jgi:hypothetical protein